MYQPSFLKTFLGYTGLSRLSYLFRGKSLTVIAALASILFSTATIADENACGTAGDYEAFVCEPQTEWFDFGAWINARIDYFMPEGLKPESGWPVVILLHGGSGNLTGVMYEAQGRGPLGGLKNMRGNSARTIKLFLENGFAVIAPHAPLVNWQTNWPLPYSWTSDYAMFNKFFARLDNLAPTDPEYLQQIDTANMFATGVSDGGAQSSRMARTWFDRFEAIAINEGSWNKCFALGPFAICNIPAITWDHPDTLLLHAEADSVVAIRLSEMYGEALDTAGIPWRGVVARDCADGETGADDCVQSDYTFAGTQCEAGDYYCVRYQDKPVYEETHDWLDDSPLEQCQFFSQHLSVPRDCDDLDPL